MINGGTYRALTVTSRRGEARFCVAWFDRHGNYGGFKRTWCYDWEQAEQTAARWNDGVRYG